MISNPLMNSCLYKHRREQGYVLLVMLLFISLLSIGFLAVTEGIESKIKRDREEELIHRGLEYSRAVRRYVKQFGRYPNSVEDLENSNNVRFLRKRYKDPITRRDFKLLYYGDLKTYTKHPAPAPATLPPPPPAPNLVLAEGLPPEGQAQMPPGADSNGTPLADQSAANQGEAASQPPSENPSDVSPEDTGGRAIVGVTSYSESKTIRVFSKMNHYNEWQFVYDPTNDTGLMRGPNQPLLKGAGQTQPLENGQDPAQNSVMNRGPN
jgi:type II secretory pathway pseudopilin PulG